MINQNDRGGELLWGKNPVTELLRSGAGADTLYLADSLDPRAAGYYTALARQAGAGVKRVPAGKLQKMTGTADHQGVAVPAATTDYVALEALLPPAAPAGAPPVRVE